MIQKSLWYCDILCLCHDQIHQILWLQELLLIHHLLLFICRVTLQLWEPVSWEAYMSALRKNLAGDRSGPNPAGLNGNHPRPNWTRIRVSCPKILLFQICTVYRYTIIFTNIIWSNLYESFFKHNSVPFIFSIPHFYFIIHNIIPFLFQSVCKIKLKSNKKIETTMASDSIYFA